MTKDAIEMLLDQKPSEELVLKAFDYAKQKQKQIFLRDGNPDVMQDWYLEALWDEYIQRLAFSGFTLTLYNMKRECTDNCTPSNANILYHGLL